MDIFSLKCWLCNPPGFPIAGGCQGSGLSVEIIEGWSHLSTDMNPHSIIDDRSLAFGRAIVARLHNDASLVDRAGFTLGRWLETCSPQARPALLEWKAVLAGPLAGVIALLTGSSERAVRLRQSNPFAGVLPPSERLAIIREFAAHE